MTLQRHIFWQCACILIALNCIQGDGTAPTILKRIVVTLREQNACDITLPDDTCASVARCDGNRLVLEVAECSEIFTLMTLHEDTSNKSRKEAVLSWIKDIILANFITIEEDATIDYDP